MFISTANKTLDIDSFLTPDKLACEIASMWCRWDELREPKKREWQEIERYIFATDTTKTSNSSLPWSNKTTIPKTCQIRDNLFANYMAALFPKKKSIVWEGSTTNDDDRRKVKAIESYMTWVVDRPDHYREVSKIVLDYIDKGNFFYGVEWQDNTLFQQDKRGGVIQTGFAGPVMVRISPYDIVFDPTASDFKYTPKIIRSLVSPGQVKKMIMSTGDATRTEEDQEQLEALWNYLLEVREQVGAYQGDLQEKDDIYRVAGFDSFRAYLNSNTVEILTFYGDIYDSYSGEMYSNVCIKVVDRHKIFYNKPVDSYFPHGPIFHGGWRVRPDSLWAMGPLDNLIGMQYRIDHLENMKADVFDLIAYPPIKVKGYVEDWEWGPMERIYVGDDGDVELMSPDVQALQADTQIAILEQKMEEMAGSPKEAMGFRTPGEKTKYEVQRLENSASRIFQNKTSQFERDGLEPGYNAMLELARRNMNPTIIRLFDDEMKIADFLELTAEDITGNGRIRAIGARNFAEKANLLQNITSFFGSHIGQNPNVMLHFSGEKIARMIEEILELDEYSIVEPYIAITEQADAQRISQVSEEEVLMESQIPSGLTPEDSDEDFPQIQ